MPVLRFGCCNSAILLFLCVVAVWDPVRHGVCGGRVRVVLRALFVIQFSLAIEDAAASRDAAFCLRFVLHFLIVGALVLMR